MERKDDRVIAIREDEYQPLLANSIIEKLNSLSPLNSDCCIFTVPDRLRSVKEKAYTPKTVSIGPLHHGKQEHLKAMEEQKKWYLAAFVRTYEDVHHYVKIIKDKEEVLRSCYSEALDEFDSDNFVEMMLVDGAFVIEFLKRHYLRKIQPENDRIFNKPFWIRDIWSDFLLLENQLPFSLLEDLYDLKKKLTDPSSSSSTANNNEAEISIIDLFYNNVEHLQMISAEEKEKKLKQICESKVLHFVDLLRKLCIPLNVEHLQMISAEGKENKLKQICESKVLHFVDLLRKLYIPLNNSNNSSDNGKSLKRINIPTITQLHQAGMKFKSRSSLNMFDISFKNGILEIPKMVMNDTVETVFRNLLAFEQCYYYDEGAYLNHYAFFIDSLFDTAEDVDLLVKHGILEIWGDRNEIANLINKLRDGVALGFKKFYFAKICDDLNRYYRVPRHNWKAILKRKYFNTPWAIISVIAAISLILLTIIQAVCSILSVVREGKK